jgi:hypothetical protein
MTLAEARRRDKIIHDLAFYETTQGMMLTEMSAEGVINLHRQIAKKFNEFKKLVQSGEYSIEELENDVTSRNAAVASPTVGRSIDELDDYVKEFDKEESARREMNLQAERGTDAFSDMIKSLLAGNQGGQVDISYGVLPEDHYYREDEPDDEEDDLE